MEGSATVGDCAMSKLPLHHLSSSLVQDAATNCRVTDTVGDPTKSRKRRRRSEQPSPRGRVPTQDVTALMPRVASGEHQGSDPRSDPASSGAGSRASVSWGVAPLLLAAQFATRPATSEPSSCAGDTGDRTHCSSATCCPGCRGKSGPLGRQIGSQKRGRTGSHQRGGTMAPDRGRRRAEGGRGLWWGGQCVEVATGR